VLVPEIGLTPQLVGRFARRFPQTPLAVLHSGLTDSERLAAWRAAHSGHAQLVIGTRSAVFAPIPALGIIIVDEEHDSSFKQQEGGFRYSARDLALVRAHFLDIPIVLGSATPSLESLHNAASGRLTRLSLPDRAASASPPTLRLVDLRQERVHAGLSTTAVSAIQRHLAADGQILVYINRRGYAPTLACTACGWVAPCQSCDARMTVYRQAARLRCHHCGADRDLPRQCPQCGYAVKTVGQGTERVEESLAESPDSIATSSVEATNSKPWWRGCPVARPVFWWVLRWWRRATIFHRSLWWSYSMRIKGSSAPTFARPSVLRRPSSKSQGAQGGQTARAKY
jgi:primosomal protein N' (replication factor Y)